MNNLAVRLWDAVIAESDTHGAGFKKIFPNFAILQGRAVFLETLFECSHPLSFRAAND